MLKINFNFKSSDVVLAGISGGADSSALLYLLAEKSKKENFRLICLHVNHHIRGKSADRDAKYVETLAKSLGIEYHCYDVDCKKEQQNLKLSLEEVARILRYKCFDDAFKIFNANYLFLAHHLNDQAETILMNIIRGTGTDGAIGIKQTDKIIRPFIHYTRKQIEEFCKDNKIKYVKDKTNNDLNITRNYIRKKIIPSIEKINPNFQQKLCDFAENLRADQKFIDSVLPTQNVKINKNSKEIYILNKIFKYNEAVIFRLIKYSLKELNWAKDIFKVNYLDIINLNNKQTGASVKLPHGIVAIKEYDQIKLFKENTNINCEDKAIDYKLGHINIFNKTIDIKVINTKDISHLNLKSDEIKYIDIDKMPKNAIFRHRKNGDIFTKFGGGTTTLSEYLIDKKIPKTKRNDIIVLACGKEILWIAGIEISDKIKVTEKTKNIVSLKIQ